MTIDSENQKQLALLSIFAEHPGQLLYKLAPQIAELFGIPNERTQEVFDRTEAVQIVGIPNEQALEVFDRTEFVQIMQTMWKEWLIGIDEFAFDNGKPQFSSSMAHDIRIRVERRGVESLRAGKIAPSAIGNRRPSNLKPPTTLDTISDLVNRKTQQPRKFTSQREAIERIAASIAARRGQKEFRNKLLCAYGATCLITGPNIEAILEAAHIQPYADGGPFEVTNGLLLRADIHTLFDLYLIAIDSTTMTVLISPALHGTPYADLKGNCLTFPDGKVDRPSPELLEKHRQLTGLAKATA